MFNQVYNKMGKDWQNTATQRRQGKWVQTTAEIIQSFMRKTIVLRGC